MMKCITKFNVYYLKYLLHFSCYRAPVPFTQTGLPRRIGMLPTSHIQGSLDLAVLYGPLVQRAVLEAVPERAREVAAEVQDRPGPPGAHRVNG